MEPKEIDEQQTAFQVGPLGFYECNCMPLGLCNAPAIFQRLMERCLGVLNLCGCLIYLDTIIVFSSILERYLEKFQVVFSCLALHSLKLKAIKYEFLKTEWSALDMSCLNNSGRSSQN